jgi:CreA protein
MAQEQQSVEAVAVTTPFDYDRQIVVSVNVSDLERSITWYREALGFEVTYKLDEYGWCEIATATPNVSIGLGQTEQPKVEGGTTPTFGVKDIAAARAHLESHDVRFDGDTYAIEGMVKLCTFYDPDGNAWMLAEAKDRDERFA